jgi:hypothetical protein
MAEEDLDYSTGQELGEKPPEVSIGLLIETFKKKGIVEALNDESLGPHTHLLFLLGLVTLISIIIGIYLGVSSL